LSISDVGFYGPVAVLLLNQQSQKET